jgi:biopolymer transport protein ExbD
MQERAAELIETDAEQLFVVMPAAAAEVQQVVGVMDDLATAGASAVTLERDVFDIDLADF